MPGLDFDQAREKFIDTFLELNPKERWPAWFSDCTTYAGTKDSQNNWLFSFTAIPKQPLAAGEAWEVSAGGSLVLTSTDPATGEKRYVISNTADEVLTLFEACVHSDSGAVSILVNMDLEGVDGDGLHPVRVASQG